VSKTLISRVSVATVATDATKETTMSRERLLWNLRVGMYDLTPEQEELVREMVEGVVSEEDGWAARDLIGELEAANG
jgi:hypothetical protein